MAIPIPYVHDGIGLFMSLLSVPLIMRKVPRNRIYGIRIRKACVSQHNWYEINAYGGKLLLSFGLSLLAFSWCYPELAPPPTSAWAPVYLAIPLLPIIPLLVLVNIFAERLPER